jgi:hypothetical protein
MSRSNRFNDFIERNPGTEERIVNAEFVMKQIDKALDGHTHSGTDSPLIDQSVTLDFATHGGTIYVRTPAASSGQGELPDTSGLGNTYTKDAIDNKLAGKSDTEHTHVVSNITDFPTAFKNPQPLIINGQSYDGSSEVSFDITTTDYIDNLVNETAANFNFLLNQKTNLGHTHSTSDISDFPEIYTKVETDGLLADYFTKDEVENKVSAYHTKNEVENLLDEKADKTDTYTKSEVDAAVANAVLTNADAIMTAQLTAGGAQAVETSQVRNIYAGTAAMAENASLATGAIYLQYA